MSNSKGDLEKPIHALISSRVDYCYGLFTCQNTLKQLQIIQNAAALSYAAHLLLQHPECSNSLLF